MSRRPGSGRQRRLSGDRLDERRSFYRIDASGKAETLIDLNQGSADHEYVAGERLAIVPMMVDNAVAAYKVE